MSKMTDEITAWLLTFRSVRDWETNIQSESTKALYFKYFTQYSKAVGKNPDELLALKVEGLQNIGKEKEFQAEKLLDGYLYNTEITDAIKQLVLSAVKSFFKENWRPLNPQVGSKLTVPEPKKRTPKMADILELEDAMTSQRDRAILWFLESAPFRSGTL